MREGRALKIDRLKAGLIWVSQSNRRWLADFDQMPENFLHFLRLSDDSDEVYF